MRHSFGTRMLFEARVPGGFYKVSKLLGHSRVSATEVYRHFSNKRPEQALLCDLLGVGVQLAIHRKGMTQMTRKTILIAGLVMVTTTIVVLALGQGYMPSKTLMYH